MRLLYRRCAGLDVHKKSITASVRVRVHGHKVETETAVFGTFTQDLERLRTWLKQHKVKQVAMESTGVYWIPVWNVLEVIKYRFELLLVNPQQVRALPGRKTDQQDADRLAELLQYGLLRGSFIPPRNIRQLRDLARRRVHLQRDRNRVINRIGRLLETVNVKLGSVLSDIVGKSGLAILGAIAGGYADPDKLAGYAVGKLKCTRDDLVRALDGRYDEHFRWLLRELLDELRRLDEKVADLQARTHDFILPYMPLIRRLCTIPGVDYLTACAIIAEVGVDMSVFPSAHHLASWAGLCPGNSESAGKRQTGRTRKGDRYLRRLLIQNAWAVTHKKDCYLTAVFYRVAARRGVRKAAMAIAHKILVIAYYVIRDLVEYRDPGGNYFDRKNPERTARRLARRLEQIGWDVVLRPRLPQAPKEGPPPGQTCRRCNGWGIECIHARKEKMAPPKNVSASEHSG